MIEITILLCNRPNLMFGAGKIAYLLVLLNFSSLFLQLYSARGSSTSSSLLQLLLYNTWVWHQKCWLGEVVASSLELGFCST